MVSKNKNAKIFGKYAKVDDSTAGGTTTWPKYLIAVVLVCAGFFSYVHTQHVADMFQNDRRFNYLADFEREMSYRTEMGLYFSYYKTLINAESFLGGLYEITHDNVTEHGHTINTLKRFNLYPEVILAAGYRVFKAAVKKFEWNMEWCYQINRGDWSPITSCFGWANSHYFYLNHVFALAGTMAAWVFLLGVILSDSIFGGLVAVAAFAFNHGEATRVQWTPPLRESFAYPFILAQITFLALIIRNQYSGRKWTFCLVIPTVCSLLSWQFSQFAYATQLCSLMVVYIFDYLPRPVYSTVILAHILSLFISFVMLFGNELLLTSMYFPAIIASAVTWLSLTDRISFRPLYVLISMIIFFTVMIGSKIGLSKALQVDDDAHIFDILRSKFTDFANFHTQLYTCSNEFGFMQRETVEKLAVTLLLPSAFVGILLFVLYFITHESILWRDSTSRSHSVVFYHLVQLAAFTVMAVLIMRLKLFWTSHLCATTSLLVSTSLLTDSIRFRLPWFGRSAIAAALISAMAYHGYPNIQKQWAIQGEYSNPNQELLFNWITANTPKDAVFAGTMPVMANVKLTTLRPIVNHPHYEDVGIRNRTLKVYSVFSRKPIEQVHQGLAELGVNYVILQIFNCDHHHIPSCSYRGMWDLQDPANLKRQSLCDKWQMAAQMSVDEADDLIHPFSVVYNQGTYFVMKVQ